MRPEPLAGRRVLVTGASGVVGRNLVPILLDRGADVVSVFRKRPAGFDRLDTARHAELSFDLRETPLPAPALRGVTDCVHLAATLFCANERDYYRDNAAMTQNLFSALARSAPCLRSAVVVSSLSARGPGTSADYPGGQGDARPVSCYGHSKLLCEMVAARLLPAGAGLIVLRPGIILSADDRRLMRLLGLARWIGPVMARHMPGRCSAVHVEDVSQAIVAALTTIPRPSGTYDISHPEALELRSLFRRRPDRNPLPRPANGGLVDFLARIAMLGAKITGSAPALTTDKLREASHAEWCSDSAPFTAATGWEAKGVPAEFLAAHSGIPASSDRSARSEGA